MSGAQGPHGHHIQVLPEGFKAFYEGPAPQTEDNGENESQHVLLPSNDDHQQHRSSVNNWLPGTALLAGFLSMVLFEFLHHDQDLGKPHMHDCSKVCEHHFKQSYEAIKAQHLL